MIRHSFHIILLMAAIWSLSACFKDDTPIRIPDTPISGSLPFKVVTIEMTPDYHEQHYFDFGTGTVVQKNNKTAWDLAFENQQGQFLIWMNGAKSMFASHTGTTDFASIDDSYLVGAEWQIDNSAGNPDSNAIGMWGSASGDSVLGHQEVIVLNLGEDHEGRRQGYVKLQILDYTKSKGYHIRWSPLDFDNTQTAYVPQLADSYFTHFSFKTGASLRLEPPRDAWDVVFTRYSTIIDNDVDRVPYEVTGLLLNPEKTWSHDVASGILYDSISADYADTAQFTQRWDAIGYDWKNYDIDAALFQVFTHRSFVLKDTEGVPYKIKFLSYENENGERGYIQMYYERL